MDKPMTAAERYEHGLVLKRVQMYAQAIEDFKAATHDPAYTGKAQLQILRCASKYSGRQQEALTAFRQAVASPVFTAEERRHILYHLAQTLESMGRPEESLEVYRWIRKEDPGFRDVTQRIRFLGTGKLEPASGARGSWHTWIEDVYTRSRALKPHVDAALAQTGSWISRQAAQLASHPVFQSKRVESPNAGVYRPPAGMPKSASPARAATFPRRDGRWPARGNCAISRRGGAG